MIWKAEHIQILKESALKRVIAILNAPEDEVLMMGMIESTDETDSSNRGTIKDFLDNDELWTKVFITSDKMIGSLRYEEYDKEKAAKQTEAMKYTKTFKDLNTITISSKVGSWHIADFEDSKGNLIAKIRC